MKKYLAGVIGAVLTLLFMLGSGYAYANNEYNGQTYEKAAGTIKNSGGTPVIATREGSYLPTEKCIVVGSRKQSSTSGGGKTLLNLNCNDASALNGHPGNSVATPEGKRVQQARETAKSLNENFVKAHEVGQQAYCDTNADKCKSFCQNSGAGYCSPELMQALGL